MSLTDVEARQAVRRMLQQRQVLAYEADELGVTPLMFAAAGGLEQESTQKNKKMTNHDNPMNHESLKASNYHSREISSKKHDQTTP